MLVKHLKLEILFLLKLEKNMPKDRLKIVFPRLNNCSFLKEEGKELMGPGKRMKD